MSKSEKNEFGELVQKCPYYNGRGKCAFSGQSKCIHDKGMVPFPFICGVEERMENEAMFGGDE